MQLGFYDGRPVVQHGNPTVRYVPRWLNPLYASWPIQGVEVFESFAEACRVKQPASVGFYRTYALGDILMLLPVARAVARQFNIRRVVVIVHERFVPQLDGLNQTQSLLRFRPAWGRAGEREYGCDVHIDLDRVLEIDHAGGEASDYHRLELYARALGLEITP